MPHKPRNSLLVPGIHRHSRSKVYIKKALYKRKKATIAPAAKAAPAIRSVQVKGDKNGSTRQVPEAKAPRFYPAEDVPKRKLSRKVAKRETLRGTITPGTVLILLAGRYRGKRVVFIKQLESGLLLVTGPFSVNGVPIRRVNQAYVIATSTKINLSGVTIDDKYNDTYFGKEKASRKKGTEEEFFEGEKKKTAFPESKASDQKALDKAILTSLHAVPHLRSYLNSSFTLSKGQYPHNLQF